MKTRTHTYMCSCIFCSRSINLHAWKVILQFYFQPSITTCCHSICYC